MGPIECEDDTRRSEFLVRGMDCAEEMETLRQDLVPLVGSEDRLAFDLLNSNGERPEADHAS